MLKKVVLPLSFLILISGCSMNKIAVKATGSIIEYGIEALEEESDVVFAQESAPGYLKLLEGLIKADPENEKLLLSASRGFASYSLAFIEGKDKERAKYFYLKGKDYGLNILKKNKQFNEALNKDVDSFNQALKVFVKNDVPALFWSSFNWGSWINLNLDSPEALVELPKVESIMQRVLELDETYYYGGAHTFFGTAYGFRPPMLGGNLEKAREHFDKAGKIADGKFLLNYVYKARYYAVPIQDRNLFEAILQEVILAPPDILPEQRLVNEIAKVKAKEMLSQIDEFF